MDVRLLYDHVGSWKFPGYGDLNGCLDSLGIRWTVMLPLKPWRWRFRRPDLRNHRKIITIDGKRGFMGSQNLIDPSYLSAANLKQGRHWVDYLAELKGPVVTELDSIFAVDWYTESQETLDLLPPSDMSARLDDNDEDTGEDLMQVVPSGPGFSTEPNLHLFTAIIHAAKHRVTIVSPYFIPDEALAEAVLSAAYRGVRVELFVNQKADQFMVGRAQASYYEELLKAGVRIYQYPYPAVLHSKFVICDDDVAVMGSSNMDMRSFMLNYEVVLMTFQGRTMNALRTLAEEYKSRSQVLDATAWRHRPWYQKYMENVARLTSALQ